MKTFAVGIRLVIPDNTAQTALTTLRRLGVALSTLDRADVWEFDVADGLTLEAFLQRAERIEAIYNPNKHRAHFIKSREPGAGEVWIRDIDESVPADAQDVLRAFGPDASAVRHRTAWRLLDEQGRPVSPDVVRRACGVLLCNAAFQEATLAPAANAVG